MEEAVWVQSGQEELEENLKLFKHYLVGRWEDFAGEAPEFGSLKAWACKNRNLVGNFNLLFLGGALILSEFKNAKDAERVRHMGCFTFDGKRLQLDRWCPKEDCFKEGGFY